LRRDDESRKKRRGDKQVEIEKVGNRSRKQWNIREERGVAKNRG
jgi:hypothetical protein